MCIYIYIPWLLILFLYLCVCFCICLKITTRFRRVEFDPLPSGQHFAMENGPVIVDLPIKRGDFQLCKRLPELLSVNINPTSGHIHTKIYSMAISLLEVTVKICVILCLKFRRKPLNPGDKSDFPMSVTSIYQFGQ